MPIQHVDVDTWLEDLEGRLPRHGHVLRCLRDRVRGDPRVVQLSVGCSVVRGNADELSDLDCSISLEPDAWPSGIALIEPLVRSCGDVVELLQHRWAGAGTSDHLRTAAVYASGVQLDLMAWPVTVWSGMHPPTTLVLHETRPVFTQPWDPARAAAAVEQLREWRFCGWWSLLDADKYLRRNSPWEARQRLEEARTAVWQMSAAHGGVPFAEYGITSLLDAPDARLPEGIEGTAADLTNDGMRAAVRECAQQLAARWRDVAAANPALAAVPPIPAWAHERLDLPVSG